jgi:anti-sigma factor RsiW
MTDLVRGRPDSCASDLRLDSLVAGELGADEERDTRAHLAGCSLCAARMAELHASRADFAAHRPPLRRRAPAPKAWRRWAPVAAVAAAALLVVWIADPFAPGGTRTKGSANGRVRVYVKHGDTVRLAGPGEAVEPGDALAFTVSMTAPAEVAVLGIDGAGRASVYSPAAARTSRLGPGQGLSLPDSAVLDGVLGDERIIALFCDRPLALEPVRAAFAASPHRPPIPDGCEADQLTLAKRPAR